MRWIALALALAAVGGLVWLGVHAGWFSARPPHVILLSVDTLRPDHLGCYGYAAPTSPSIDCLMEDAVRFTLAVCQMPTTTPSFCSVMTGAHPHTHGSLQNSVPLRPETETLAELLRKNGYQTAAFVSSYTVSNESSGLARGFDVFDDDLVGLERSSKETNRRLFEFLDRRSPGPLLLWVHYFDPHAPYVPHPGISPETFAGPWQGPTNTLEDAVVTVPPWVQTERGLAYYGMRYDSEIAFVDGQIGVLVEDLRARGMLENALVVFLSDHGEGFDHGLYCRHGPFVYESSVRIPLGFRFPERRYGGRTITDLVQSIDVAPTICDFLGISRPEDSEGRSLMPLLEGRDEGERAAFIQRRHYGEENRFGLPSRLYAIRTKCWKYIHSPDGKPELYDLVEDPGELENLATGGVEPPARLRERLDLWIERAEAGAPEDAEIGEEARSKLKSLGYLQ